MDKFFKVTNRTQRITELGTQYVIEKWLCPLCNKEKSTLEIDGEWCHGDSKMSRFTTDKAIHGCTECILKEADYGEICNNPNCSNKVDNENKIKVDEQCYCSEECAREGIGLEFLHGMCDVSK